MRQVLIALTLAATLGGCGGRKVAPTAEAGPREAAQAPASSWRAIATPADRERLRAWRDSWVDALARARASGAAQAIAAQGALLLPDTRLADPLPPPGDYRCRVFKLGAKGLGGLNYVAYQYFTCRIARDGPLLRLEKMTGSQRPVGRIFPDPAGRPVFLGTLMLGDETRPLAYGRDQSRDLAGFVDRVGERQWRLALPLPAFESLVDVIELVPAAS